MAVLLGLPQVSFAQQTTEVRVCADAMAYTTKLGKAERRRREEEARREALVNLAERAWAEANRSVGGKSVGRPAADPVSATLRIKYKLEERLGAGVYRFAGDNKRMRVVYCLPSEVYDGVTEEIRAQRERVIASLVGRFTELERLIEAERKTEASRLLTDLEIDVVNEELEQALYESVVDQQSKPFYVWLIEWGDVVDKSEDFAAYMTGRALQLIEQGHLDAADRYVQEALDADRDYDAAEELRELIQQRRIERAAMLRDAEKLAASGRFDAAQRKLERAAEINRDEPVQLEELSRAIDGMRAAYLQYNPVTSGLFYTAVGALGADHSAIEERVFQDVGWPVDASVPFSFGGGASFRQGRFMVLGVEGGFGISNDQSLTFTGQSPDLYYMYQLIGSVSYRTQRSAKRRRSMRFGGGVVWESVEVELNSPNGLSSSDSQAAFFVQFALEWKDGTFFIRHGLGFDEVDNSLVGWSNSLQIGGGFVF